jgi:hypothetical protein
MCHDMVLQTSIGVMEADSFTSLDIAPSSCLCLDIQPRSHGINLGYDGLVPYQPAGEDCPS